MSTSKLGFTQERLRPEGEPPTLFRKRYRELTDEELALHDAIKDKAEELFALFLEINTPVSEQAACVTLAQRHLEDAVYRAVKALTY